MESRSPGRMALRRFLKNPRAVLCVGLLALLAAATLVVPWVSAHDYREQNFDHTYAPPSCYTVDPLNNFLLGPTPDTDYALRGPYWRSNQTLAADDDEPEMPADYHMLIVWNALINYGYNEVANEVLSKAIARGAPIHDALMLNQAYSRFSWGMPNALA